MRLHPHQATPSSAVASLDAGARRDGARVVLDYVVSGGIDALRLAPADWPERTDGLWKTTCFEAFARAPGADAYVELNFAPSTRWAAYRFDAYRAGMAPLATSAPRIVTRKTATSFSLRASLDAAAFPQGPMALALTAVIEDTDGRISYWSLAHAPGKPDFHAPQGYILKL